MGQSLNTESVPEFGLVKFFGHFYRNIQVAAFDREIKSGGRVLNKLQSNIGREFETIFCGVNLEDARLCRPVQAVDIASLDTDKIYGLIQRSDDAVITVEKGVLHVIQGGIQKHTSIVPSRALDSDCFMQRAHLLKRLGDNGNIVLAEKRCI
ncbi:hypothetical protein BM221_010536 [Beauveria bassiana]|uniref:Uncharacterized protein n=1 Tax=Beauveria bassiana TaxID=176275 RepID=A0A2N6N8N2_BEABA|nr:hypothetical protein BM221_010536 [Beauveria bassiana]